MSDERLKSILSDHKLSPSDELPTKATRLAVIKHFSTTTPRPMPSSEFLKMRSTVDIAEWFSKIIRPPSLHEHVTKLIATARMQDLENVEKMIAEDGGKLDPKVAEQIIPENLTLDPKTFQPGIIKRFGTEWNRKKIIRRKK